MANPSQKWHQKSGMDLSKKLVKEFQKIFKAEYGQILTYQEAKNTGEALTQYFEVLVEIDKEQKIKTTRQ